MKNILTFVSWVLDIAARNTSFCCYVVVRSYCAVERHDQIFQTDFKTGVWHDVFIYSTCIESNCVALPPVCSCWWYTGNGHWAGATCMAGCSFPLLFTLSQMSHFHSPCVPFISYVMPSWVTTSVAASLLSPPLRGRWEAAWWLPLLWRISAVWYSVRLPISGKWKAYQHYWH